MKKNLCAYNEIWTNCYDNMVLTLLKYINGNTNIAYKNDYDYSFVTNTTIDGEIVNSVRYGEELLELSEFADITYSEIVYSDEKLINKIKKYVYDDNCFVAINVDLFDWLPKGVCYKKYHWTHYSWISDYICKDDKFKIFDEEHGHLIETFITPEKICNCVKKDAPNSLMFVKLNKMEYSPLFTLADVYDNAKNILYLISQKKEMTYYKMNDNNYKVLYFMDLNVIHLQRIEQRHKANSRLIEMINNAVGGDEILIDCAKRFRELETQWNKLRLMLIKLYYCDSNRILRIEKINEKLNKCFDLESVLWDNIIKRLVLVKDDEVINTCFKSILQKTRFDE